MHTNKLFDIGSELFRFQNLILQLHGTDYTIMSLVVAILRVNEFDDC